MLGVSKVISTGLADAESLGQLEVWDDCWESCMMLLRMGGDWVYAGMGSCVGLNKQTLQWYMEVYRVEDRLAMLEDLQIMERHALRLMNKG